MDIHSHALGTFKNNEIKLDLDNLLSHFLREAESSSEMRAENIAMAKLFAENWAGAADPHELNESQNATA